MSQIPQTVVNAYPDLGLPGQLADLASQRDAKIDTALSAESSAGIPFGFFVSRYVSSGYDKAAKLPAATSDNLYGIAVFGQSYSRSFQTGEGDIAASGIQPKAFFDVLREGTVWVLPIQDIAFGDEVHVQAVTDSAKLAGMVGNALDAGKTIDISAFAQWESTGAATTPVKLWVDMVNTSLGIAGS